MNSIITKLTLAAAVFTMTVTLASVVPNFAALAQTTAPSAAASLPATTVKALQEALNKQGIAVKADGVFDDDTRTAIRQYQSLHHLPVTGEPDKATLDKLGVAGQWSDLPTDSPAAGAAMPGQPMGGAGAGGQGMMGMMTPEMMQMMQRMMGQGGMPGMMGGMQGQGVPEGSMGSGMMGQMPMAGGMMMCPMMQMMGARSGAGMHPMMGAAMLYGMPHGNVEEMTPERVRTFLERHLEQHGNPRLKLGEIAVATDGSITAEIVTVDGSLVQKLAFNRYPGLFRQITE
jgi:hypothetical protein